MKILALLDGRPGNDNQTLAIAEKLGEFDNLRVEFGSLAKLPNSLLGKSLAGVKTRIPIDADIVISTGRKLARVSRHIKSQNPNCKIFHMMWPGKGFESFDIIFVPKHDEIEEANVTSIIGSPTKFDLSNITPNSSLPEFTGEKIGILLGGIDSEEAKNLCDILNNQNASFYITTSRRTHGGVKLVFKLHLKKDYYFYDWRDGGENPYSTILAQSDKLIVTGDSVGMISESCSLGKPVYIFGNPTKSKFKLFHQNLYDSNAAKPLANNTLEEFQQKPLHTTNFIVEEIQKALKA